MTLLDRVADYISKHELLMPGQRVVAAVSGGPDSLALLLLLRELEYRPLVAHLDHGLRPESEAEAGFVEELAGRWDLEYRQERADPSGWSGSLESAARAARYAFLFRVAKQEKLAAIATGHTLDDQAETILLHLLRGAGPQGLAGMQPSTNLEDWTEMGQLPPDQGRLVRPLLCARREETLALCRAHGLEPRWDSSNWDPFYTRNRLRQELMPLLRQFNPAVERALARSGEVMRAIGDWLEGELDDRWRDLAREAGPGAWALQWELLQRLPLALRREALRRALNELAPSSRQVEFSVVERAVDYLRGGGEGMATLVGDLRIERAGSEAILYRPDQSVRFPRVPQISGPTTIHLDQTLELAEGWSLQLSRQDLEAAERQAILDGREPWASCNLEAIDLAAVKGRLRLRQPRRGDRWRPLGMAGQTTLSDFFVNEAIPRLQRARWPLLVDEAGILLVLGLRLAERARVGQETRQILRARLRSGAGQGDGLKEDDP